MSCPREGTESCKSLEAMALPFGEAMRLVAERRAKKQKKAKGKRGRGDSKTKEVGLTSKSFQHGEIVVDVDALIEYVGVCRQCV